MEAHFETFLNVNNIVRDALHKFSSLRKLFESVPPFSTIWPLKMQLDNIKNKDKL